MAEVQAQQPARPRRRLTHEEAIPEELKVEAVRAMVLGESARSVGRRYNISKTTAIRWYDVYQAKLSTHTAENLGDLVYTAVAEALKSLTAIARATQDPTWIAKQPADQLAQLAQVQWRETVRLIASFAARPADSPRSVAALGPGEEDPLEATESGAGAGRAGRHNGHTARGDGTVVATT